MKIIKFIIKRLFYFGFVLIGFSILIFVISRAIPGDPARAALGDTVPEYIIEQIREDMHLNKPIHIQYYYWLVGVAHGDFGKSLITKRRVIDDVKLYLPASLELVMYSGILIMVLATLFGTISGAYSNTWVDNIVRMISYLGIVTPSFVFAIFFMLIFSYILKVLPSLGRLSSDIPPPTYITGFLTIDSLITGNFSAFIDAIKHIIMPASSLMMASMAATTRIIRSSVSDNLQKDYIWSARSNGIPERLIMFKYMLKPSYIAGIAMAGASIAALIGNAFLVEVIFNWPGLSRYGMQSMLSKDLNSIIAVALIYAFLFSMLNIIVDIIIKSLDPRIELGLEKGK